MTDEPATGGATSELSIQHYDCTSPVADATVDDLVANCTASVAPSAWTLNGEPLDVGDGYAVWRGWSRTPMTVSNPAATARTTRRPRSIAASRRSGVSRWLGYRCRCGTGRSRSCSTSRSVVYCAWFVAP